MYNYVGDISNLSHEIIKNYCRCFCKAVDATLGNGYDTDFLSSIFKEVTAFEIQKDAIDAFSPRKKENVTLINDSHEYFMNYSIEEIDCFVYNLGFRPGGDKKITTKADSTILSLNQAIRLLKPGGIISVAIYVGHEEGKRENEDVLKFARELPKNEFGVLLHSFINRSDNAPLLLIIEKNL